jgi:alpha-amylase
VFQEVVDTRGEPVGVFDYVANGQVTEFLYSKRLGEAFAAGDLRKLEALDESGGLLAGDSAVVFVDNHDNQRGHGMSAMTTHRDGRRYDLASIFLLAWPYGTPKLMSSYQWGGVDDSRGPPRDGEGNTLAVFDAEGVADCGGENWVCEHRRFELLRMVDFRSRAGFAGADEVGHWWSNGPAAAFALRGREGGFAFVAVNTDAGTTLQTRLQTGLPEGRYCNLLPAGLRGALIAAGEGSGFGTPGCTVGDVTVDAEGMLDLELAPEQALVIDRERRS